MIPGNLLYSYKFSEGKMELRTTNWEGAELVDYLFKLSYIEQIKIPFLGGGGGF